MVPPSLVVEIADGTGLEIDGGILSESNLQSDSRVGPKGGVLKLGAVLVEAVAPGVVVDTVREGDTDGSVGADSTPRCCKDLHRRLKHRGGSLRLRIKGLIVHAVGNLEPEALHRAEASVHAESKVAEVSAEVVA